MEHRLSCLNDGNFLIATSQAFPVELGQIFTEKIREVAIEKVSAVRPGERNGRTMTCLKFMAAALVQSFRLLAPQAEG